MQGSLYIMPAQRVVFIERKSGSLIHCLVSHVCDQYTSRLCRSSCLFLNAENHTRVTYLQTSIYVNASGMLNYYVALRIKKLDTNNRWVLLA